MTALIEHFGALGVFVLMVPEAACIPVPSEVTLLFSGFAVSQHWMSFALAIAAATAGNVVGSLIAYAVGASGLLAAVPSATAMIDRSARMLDERGLRAVFVARLLPLARTFVSLPAGTRRLSLAPFVALTALGSAIWAAAFVIAGLLAGSAWATVSSILGKLLLAAGAIALFAAARRHR